MTSLSANLNTFITLSSSSRFLTMICNVGVNAASSTIFSSPVSMSFSFARKEDVFCDLLNVEVAVLVAKVFSERMKDLRALFVNQSGFPRPSNGRA